MPKRESDWQGAHTTTKDRHQQYFTPPELAAHVASAAAHLEADLYVELGVGDGNIFSLLPTPRIGVELMPSDQCNRVYAGVDYGRSAFSWRIPLEHRGAKTVAVVMNPPFTRQAEFFNRAASMAPNAVLHIIWIAGLNVRLWTTEDSLSRRMHLKHEELVPNAPEWSRFSFGDANVAAKRQKSAQDVRCVVQTWTRGDVARRLWNLRARKLMLRFKLVSPSMGLRPGLDVAITRVGSPSQIGKAVVVGENTIVTRESREKLRIDLTDSGVTYVGEKSTRAMGTVCKKSGTAHVLRPRSASAADAEALAQKLNALWRDGVLRDLFYFRTSSGGFSRFGGFASLSLEAISTLLDGGLDRLGRTATYIDEPRGNVHAYLRIV